MTKDEINIAIAQHLGGTVLGNVLLRKSSSGYIKPVGPLPNYHGDLNAMHEAERTLDGATEWNGEENHACAEEAYMGHLSRVVKDGRFADDWQLITATAAQRAEAFLRVHNLWRE
jgi:hypothetical protein